MPEKHAMLGASSAARWLACPPSAKLNFALPEQTSAAAEEGTRAHALAEKVLRAWLAGRPPDTLVCDDMEMREAVERYTGICIEKVNEARKASADAQVFVEHMLDFSRWVPGGFGTGDMVMISDDLLEVVDFKYGKGVKVEAAGNAQMRLYALGMFDEFGLLYGAQKVHMTIVQPRLDSVETAEMTVKELLAWIDAQKDAIALAAAGEGARHAGAHCRFCKAKATCRTLADYELAGVKEDFAATDLTEMEIADIISRAASIKRWLTDIESYALGQAMDGKTIPGMKLVEGRRVRRVADQSKAIEKLLAAGYPLDEIVKPQELETLTRLSKVVGKKKLDEVLDGLIEKPRGKPTLVPMDDRRKPLEVKDIKEFFDDGLIN